MVFSGPIAIGMFIKPVLKTVGNRGIGPGASGTASPPCLPPGQTTPPARHRWAYQAPRDECLPVGTNAGVREMWVMPSAAPTVRLWGKKGYTSGIRCLRMTKTEEREQQHRSSCVEGTVFAKCTFIGRTGRKYRKFLSAI